VSKKQTSARNPPQSAVNRSGAPHRSATPIIAPFDTLVGQDIAARFLSAVVASGKPHHAYTFIGPLGAGKTTAARAFAQALLCENGGVDTCDTCVRVAHGSHPDFHLIEPQGTSGYLLGQIQALIRDSNRAPVRARRKVYLLPRADLLQDAAANALLKTLEEPPPNTVIILLARVRSAVKATLLSRCQILAFRRIPLKEALAIISQSTGASEVEARIALAATGGSLLYAKQFWRSPERRQLRVAVIEALERLPHADDADLLDMVKNLLVAMKAPLDVVLLEQQEYLQLSRDYLGKGALKRLEQQQRRELSSRERETIGEALEITRSWLRDIMMLRAYSFEAQTAQTHGALQPIEARGAQPTFDIVNADFYSNIQRLAGQVRLESCVRALEATQEAQKLIQYNVNPQLALEVLFLAIRAELEA
jgi:DNA polymerase-3 subunit delta'